MEKSKVRELIRQFCAELLGTFLLVLLGCGSIAQVTTGEPNDFFSDFQSICFGWGFALMIGILVSGGVSGGHLNPAVTLAMAALKKCSWIQVPVYWLAQYLGAFLAATVVYLNYTHSIDEAGGKSAKTRAIFATYPNDAVGPSTLTLAFDETVGTALLVIIILSVVDQKNMKVPNHLAPLYIGFGLCAILMSFGLNSDCALNPARDFSPRILTLIAGWSVEDTFVTGRYFFWIPLILPHIGALIGAALYFGLVEIQHPKSQHSDEENNKHFKEEIRNGH